MKRRREPLGELHFNDNNAKFKVRFLWDYFSDPFMREVNDGTGGFFELDLTNFLLRNQMIFMLSRFMMRRSLLEANLALCLTTGPDSPEVLLHAPILRNVTINSNADRMWETQMGSLQAQFSVFQRANRDFPISRENCYMVFFFAPEFSDIRSRVF